LWRDFGSKSNYAPRTSRSISALGQAGDLNRNIVAASSIQSKIKQCAGSLFHRASPIGQFALNLLLRDGAPKTVGAEQQCVACFELHVAHLHANVELPSQASRQHRCIRMGLYLLRRDLIAIEQILPRAVVAGKQSEFPVVNQVRAAVAHAADDRLHVRLSMFGVPAQQRNNDRCPHAAVPMVLLRRRRHDRRICPGYGFRYRKLRWKKQRRRHPLNEQRNRMHGDLLGSPTVGIAANAVRNDEQIAETSADVADRAPVVSDSLSMITLAGEVNA
jgi:hypothetical protein